jgi:type IV pilus assembly protein PilM
MVDTCHDSLDIVVLGEGIPEVVRSLQVAPEMSPGERIAVLRSELERSVSFYNAAHMDKPIDLTVPILVSGDLAGQESEMTSLAGPRERPVRSLESPLVGLEGFDPGRYMACIGLALKDIMLTETGAVANSVVNFNALPEIYQVRKRVLAEVLWVPTVLVGVVLIGMGTWGIIFLKSENSDLVSQRDNINRTMQEQLVRKADLTALTTQVGTAEAPAAGLKSLLDSLDAGRISIATDLGFVQEYATDSGVSLGNVSVTSKGINVGGSADTEDQVFNYGWLLEKKFSTVMIPSISASETGVQFSMVLTK